MSDTQQIAGGKRIGSIAIVGGGTATCVSVTYFRR